MNIIFTSPRPIASTPRSFSQIQPISHSEPPPANAPISAPTSDVTPIGISASAPCESDGMSSKRSEEHTSELQSRLHLVCRLLLEKTKEHTHTRAPSRRRAVRPPPALQHCLP